MASKRGRWVLVVCLIALGGALWRTGKVEHKNRQLTDSYTKATKMVEELQTEHDQLNAQLSSTRQTVEGQEAQIGNLQQELQSVDGQLKETLIELAALKREHDELTRSHAELGDNFQVLNEEKKQLEMRLSSLNELKKAIRQVKRELWNQRFAAWRARIEAQRKLDQERLALGNRGFMIRDGRSTVRASQLQVHVLEPQPQ